MRNLMLLAALLSAAPLSAQLPPGLPQEREPKAGRDLDRFSDQVRARQGFEASRKKLTSAKLREAIARYEPGQQPELHITWGEFIAADGTQFLAMQFAPGPATHFKPDTRVTLFGTLVSERGRELDSFEEPMNVASSKRDVYLERSLLLPERKFVATFGVALRGEVLAMGRANVDAEELPAKAPGLSRLIVSDNVYNLQIMQKPYDPFAFGGTKVVPKPDRAFRRTDEVWLFAELRNPTVGTDGAPKLKTKIEISSAAKMISSMNTAIDPLPLKGVPGHFGLGTTIDLGRLAPGDYQVTLTITDTLANRTFQRAEAIKLVE